MEGRRKVYADKDVVAGAADLKQVSLPPSSLLPLAYAHSCFRI